jgi:hypothetical protein
MALAMRHCVASLMAKKVLLVVVCDQLGHATTQTTNRYSHTEADAVSIAVEHIPDFEWHRLTIGGQF